MENYDMINNDPELNGKYLGTITQDFVKMADNLREASYQIRKRGFSEYPIFAISRTEIPVGTLLYGKDELDLQWNYFASYLENFIQQGLIDRGKKDEFTKTYKNPDEFCCLFVVDKEFTSFIYIPYPED